MHLLSLPKLLSLSGEAFLSKLPSYFLMFYISLFPALFFQCVFTNILDILFLKTPLAASLPT